MLSKTQQHLVLIGIFVLLAILVLGGTFHAGTRVGHHMAAKRTERVLKKLGIPREELKGLNGGHGHRNGKRHGTSGEIQSMTADTIVILTSDNEEKILSITPDTRVMYRRQERSMDDLAVGSGVIALGKPSEDGIITVRRLIIAPW